MGLNKYSKEKYKRLHEIASFIEKDRKVLDLATDHCILPIILINNKITDKIYASDISPNSIKVSEKNLKDRKLEIKKLILSNGFENIENPNYFDYIVIAGVGGKLISTILEQKKVKRPTLILHPTHGAFELRTFLSKKGFKIIEESLIIENGIENIIIVAKRNVFSSNLTKKNAFLGPILKLNLTSEIKEYYRKQQSYYFTLYNKSNKKIHYKFYKWIKKLLANEN